MAPYREENGRLLTQLNALHMENIALREHNEKHSKGMEAGVDGEGRGRVEVGCGYRKIGLTSFVRYGRKVISNTRSSLAKRRAYKSLSLSIIIIAIKVNSDG